MTMSAFLSRGTLLFAGVVLVAGCGGSGPEPEVEPTPPPVATSEPEPMPEPEVRDETAKYQDPNVQYASVLRPIQFDFNKYNIRSDAVATLEGIASLLKSNTDWKVLVEGHCDERGTNEYNLGLGEQRALATYQETRDRLSGRLFSTTDDIASFAWNLDQIPLLLLQLSDSMSDEVAWLGELDPCGHRVH